MDEIDVKLLRAFVEVVRDMSFTRAAARTGVGQPRR
jgi:DNA-binding transcriptional LysR family regulator